MIVFHISDNDRFLYIAQVALQKVLFSKKIKFFVLNLSIFMMSINFIYI